MFPNGLIDSISLLVQVAAWGQCWSTSPSQWRHNERDGVWNHQRHDLLNRLFKRRPTTTRDTCLCAGNSPVTGEFPAQRASNAENVSIWWRHHGQHMPSLGYSELNDFATVCNIQWYLLKINNSGLFYRQEIVSVPVWISNHIPRKLSDVIT